MATINQLIEKEIDQLPALPTTVMKVLEVCKNPNLKPADLNKVISLDPVLTGAVLKLINSAYYALSEKMTSIVRAIIMLGINTVKNLALSTAVMGTMQKTGNMGALDMEGYWRHCLGVGVTAKKIALKTGVDPKFVEEYFISGLLHDIGKVVINKALADDYYKVIRMSDDKAKELFECEKELLGIDHIEIAAKVCEKWRFSKDLIQAIVHHHSPLECSPESRKIVYTVYIANAWCNQNSIGFSGNMGPSPIKKEVFDFLGIEETEIYKWENEIENEIQNATIFLNITQAG
jgi:putative nucleotidyltransferase with HDIG domain